MTRNFDFRHWVLSLCFGTLVSGCASTQTNPPLTTSPAPPQARAHRAEQRSWMDPSASGNNLLYVSSITSWPNGDVYVFTYPQGRLVGTLTGFIQPLGECTDAMGDVFIVGSANESFNSSIIYEYAHGGTKPIAMLSDPNPAVGCAVDPKSGNLAASGGGVAVYKHASGEPTMYESSEFIFYFCGYDNNSNLYVSANNGQYGNEAQFVRLASGSSYFDQITVSTKLFIGSDFPPSVQWDGKRMTVSSASSPSGGPASLYRLRISGSNGTVIGTTMLSSKRNHTKTGQLFINGRRVLGTDYYRGGAGIDSWSYPNAGKSRRVVHNAYSVLYGIAVSPASSR